MARTCTVCRHPEREAIEKALVSGEPVRSLVSRYVTKSGRPLGHMALYRHKDEHLPEALRKAQGAAELASADALMAELRRCLGRVTLLYDACDRWLRDPEHPEQYDVGPRAGDVTVTYTESAGEGRPVRKKAKLSELLARLETGAALTVERGEYRHSDPRDLLLKTSAQLQSHLELLAKLLGELDDRPTINLTLAPEWVATRAALLEALGPFPDARAAVAGELMTLERSGGANGHRR